ncbi:MAG: hypothetical protein QOJ79_366 [Actinomycetota bacterium]|nr:hypothetical protein [Actinomycetota bacterium]
MALRRRALPALLASTALAAAGLALVTAPLTATAATTAPAFTNWAAPSSLFGSDNAGEPSLGVNGNSGAMMYQSYASTYKVTVNATGAPSWSDVTPVTSNFNIDPILATDRTTGRTFAGGLAGECSALSYTDNDGGSWTQMGNACAGVLDHESIGSGPWKGAAPLGATYNRAVYYCAQNGNDACATSTNGGLTFGAPALVGGACGSLHGHVKVAPSGTAYLPDAHCGGVAGGGITKNNGSSWSSYTIPGSTEPADGFDPSVTVTPDNTVYEAWQQGNNHPYVARSTTEGSWDRVTDLSTTYNPPIVNSTFQAATSGDNGRVAVAYLGSTTAGNPFSSSWHGVWDLYVSTSYDGGLTWTTVKATTDPVQRGWMCAGGTSCGSGRNLLDFMDANTTKDGRIVVGYADGCIGACATASGTEAQSSSAWATIAYQSDGKNLLAAYDGTAPSPTPSPSASPSASPTPSPSASPSVSPTTSPSASPSSSPSPSPTATTDPDPSTPTLTSGTATTGTSAATGGYTYYKVSVPAGAASLKVTLKGPNCNGKNGCNPDLSLYGLAGSKPTTTSNTASSATAGSNAETFTVSGPAAGYYYIGVYTAAGSKTGSFTLTAT